MSTSAEPHVFASHIANVPLPLPPTHVAAEYEEEGGRLIRTPSRFNYVVPGTARVVVQRDPLGNDYGSDDNGRATFINPDVQWVYNGRCLSMQLHQNGFELLSEAPFTPMDIDFLSRDQVLSHYYPHCQQLLQQHLQSFGGSEKVQVWAFDHNVRYGGNPSTSATTTVQKPLGIVHGDYTTTSGPRRIALLGEPPKINDIWRDRLPLHQLALLNPEMVEECLQGRRRYALINVWRNIDPEHPVLSTPLACVDATSHAVEDLRILELQYRDRQGENYLVCPSENHRWVYFPEMTCAEALLIKQWDSSSDVVAKFSLHSAFLDPTTPTEAPPRQSIEVRCVAIWDPA